MKIVFFNIRKPPRELPQKSVGTDTRKKRYREKAVLYYISFKGPVNNVNGEKNKQKIFYFLMEIVKMEKIR